MKAYISENRVVIAVGIIDDFFPNCTTVEITESEKLFIEACKLPKLINGVFVDDYVEIIEVPLEISKMDLSLQLLIWGITDQDIFDDIDSIPDVMFPPIEKEKAKIKYITAARFERNNADLNLVATMEGLTQENVDSIFIEGNKRI